MLTKFYEVALQRIRKQKEQYVNRLINGNVQSFDDYRSVCGHILGLTQAEEILKKLFDDIQEPISSNSTKYNEG